MIRRLRQSCFFVAVTLAGLAVVRAESSAGDAAPSTWFGEPDYRLFRVAGAEGGKLEVSVATLDTPAGKQEGLRFTVREHCENPLAVMAVASNVRPVAAKDTLSAHFFMRTVSSEAESGEGKVQFIVEDSKTYDKSVQFPAATAGEWKEFNLPFAAKGSYAPGTASVIFRLGYRRQTVEIAGFEIRDYGSSVAVSSLPMTKPDLSYAGMEANAPWRAAADARIAAIRKSALTVEVVGPDGKPVADAQVKISQSRHAFTFGTAISANTLLKSASGPDTRVSDAVLQNFNSVTFENDLKWAQWERDRELPLQAARWCKEHGLALRGHNMVWPSWRHLPPALKELRDKPAELRQTILHHVDDVGRALAPYATIWDVVNETFNNHDLMDLLGDGVLTEIYRKAREAAPDAKLFINDYGILSGNGLDQAHQKGYERTIRYLLDQHAPLEGIGIQGHFGQEYTPPERLYTILERFAKFGLPMQLTEFSAMAEDREMDAAVMRDVMTVCFSHAAVDAFIFWGFYDGKGFEHKATLYDAEGQLTPVGKMYRELVFHRWWTQESATTGNDGTARVQGFHGRYEVSVTHGDATAKSTVELRPGGSTVKIVLGK